jgi:hypothetical protein
MPSSFPFEDVILKKVPETSRVKNPLFGDNYWQMNQNEFSMQVEGVADFYALNGKEIDYTPVKDASPESIQLYLNGSVYGAILHQRQILPIHGSSFAVKGNGVMLCGESGTGKSSLTAAFSLNDFNFLTDDITPVVFIENVPYILALSDTIKLWDDSLNHLDLDKSDLKRVSPDMEKFYYSIDKSNSGPVSLKIIYMLSIYDQPETEISEVFGTGRFSSLYNEIYRMEFLKGMPENEKIYFINIVDISNNVRIFKVNRPGSIKINDLKIILSEHIISTL